MPKLDHFQTLERLQARLADLENGVEVEARDIKVLLTHAQNQSLHKLWDEQQAIRKTHKTKSQAEADGLVWKTKKEIRIDVYRQAVADSKASALDEIRKEQARSEARAARIYMDAYIKAKDEGRDPVSAANIALVRNGFNRTDNVIRRAGLNKRDKEIMDMEDAIKAEITRNMTAEKFEQYQLLNDYENSVNKSHSSKR